MSGLKILTAANVNAVLAAMDLQLAVECQAAVFGAYSSKAAKEDGEWLWLGLRLGLLRNGHGNGGCCWWRDMPPRLLKAPASPRAILLCCRMYQSVQRIVITSTPRHLFLTNTPAPGVPALQLPLRHVLQSPAQSMLFMPGRVNAQTAIKIVSVPKASSDGLPGTTLVMDEETGRVRAVINARRLTALRNAAGEFALEALGGKWEMGEGARVWIGGTWPGFGVLASCKC
jgi:hypothetical protein